MSYSALGFIVETDDNTDELLRAFENAINRGLKVVGETAVKHAQDKCPIDTGHLRESITYEVSGEDCYIGTNVKYAPYVEFGTGIHATTGGRHTPWVYQDDKGNWHRTTGQKPQPYLKPAAANHTAEYRDIIKRSLENM